MKKLVSLGALIAAVGLGTSAAAAQGQDWSVLTARTVGTNQNFLRAQAGWPGVSGTLIHGMTPTLDLGGIFTFNYGLEGDVNDAEPGIKLQGLARIMLSDTGKFNLGLTFAPGPLMYFGHSRTLFGFTLPAGLVFGIPVNQALNINLGADIPFWFYVNQGGGAVIPILFGGGVEYFIDRNTAVTFNTRMGPMIVTNGGTRTFCTALPLGWGCIDQSVPGYTSFALQALIGLAVRL